MPGLHSARQNELTVSPDASSASEPAPQLRVVTADSGDPSGPLELFEAAIGRGDLSRARDALLAVREEQRAEQQRIELEKNDLLQAVQDLQQLLDERCQAHEQELLKQKQRLTEWHGAEKQALMLESDEVAAEIQAARDAWEVERQEQAAALAEEKSKLDANAEELLRQQDEIECQLTEIADQRTQLEEELKSEQQERTRVFDEVIAQRENEWAERQRQLEHELDSQRKLHQKQLTLDRESFMRACSEREADLDAIRADVDQQRKELVEERCRSAEHFSETRRQLEQDRTLLQNGLRQMESQLRWVAGSISISGGPLPPRAETLETGRGEFDSGDSPPEPARALTDQKPETPAAPAVDESAVPDFGWLGVVAPRPAVEVPELADPAETSPPLDETPVTISNETPEPSTERRQQLEDYRSQLSRLQASLSDLQAASGADDDAESDH